MKYSLICCERDSLYPTVSKNSMQLLGYKSVSRPAKKEQGEEMSF